MDTEVPDFDAPSSPEDTEVLDFEAPPSSPQDIEVPDFNPTTLPVFHSSPPEVPQQQTLENFHEELAEALEYASGRASPVSTERESEGVTSSDDEEQEERMSGNAGAAGAAPQQEEAVVVPPMTNEQFQTFMNQVMNREHRTKVEKPPTYDGKPETLRTFLVQC